MWDTVRAALTSENATGILITVIVLAVTFLSAVKFGWIRIKTSHIKIGAMEDERSIVRNQIEWAHLFITSLAWKIPDDDGYNGYFMKYIFERIYDEVVNWITFNHITTKGNYVKIKQSALKSLVYGLDVRNKSLSEVFEEKMDGWTEEIISGLIDIREQYR